jgi:DmsE family decaheme c-type cytochrome
MLWLAAPQSVHAQQPVAAAARACHLCHQAQFAAESSTPHAALATPEALERRGDTVACIACHGDASQHMQAGGSGPIFTFRDEAASQQSAVCLDCHDDDHPGFAGSAHAAAGMTCTACHRLHGGDQHAPALLRAAAPPLAPARVGARSTVCFDCHGEIFTQFALNERHRLLEGVLECVSCHDPHGPASRAALGGFKQAQCVGCHADKSGPFVFEHAASRVEGCTACHAPHGSPNRHLLAIQDTGALCYSCHVTVPQFHLGFGPAAPARFGLDTQCTNCHATIHGSNFDPLFLR